ncbi:MAG: hypothetical protein WED33_10445 [Bacteroidia bacterium]
MKLFRNRIASIFLPLLLACGLLLSISSCDEDDEVNLQAVEDYQDSMNMVVARNAFLGTYLCDDACNMAVVHQNFLLNVTPDPDEALELIFSNIGGLSANDSDYVGQTFKANILGFSETNLYPKSGNLPPQVFITENFDTIIMRAEFLILDSVITMEYRTQKASLPERVCITNGVKLP